MIIILFAIAHVYEQLAYVFDLVRVNALVVQELGHYRQVGIIVHVAWEIIAIPELVIEIGYPVLDATFCDRSHGSRRHAGQFPDTQ